MSSVGVGSAFSAYDPNNFNFFPSTDSIFDLPCGGIIEEAAIEEAPSESPLRRAAARLTVLVTEQETIMQKALRTTQFPQQDNSLIVKWRWLEENKENRNCSVYRYTRSSSATAADKLLKAKLPVPKTFSINGKQMMSVVSSPTLDSIIVTEQVVPVTE